MVPALLDRVRRLASVLYEHARADDDRARAVRWIEWRLRKEVAALLHESKSLTREEVAELVDTAISGDPR